MYGVNKIDIYLNELYVVIDLLGKYIEINNNRIDINCNDINNLFKIIRLWNNKYVDNNIIDSEEFKINIYSSDGIEVIYGKGKYPNNYNELKDWVGGMYARTIE